MCDVVKALRDPLELLSASGYALLIRGDFVSPGGVEVVLEELRLLLRPPSVLGPTYVQQRRRVFLLFFSQLESARL